jgi:hypothetical protein
MSYNYSQPGVIFIDPLNRLNKLNYCEKIIGTNSCGEQRLPPSGAVHWPLSIWQNSLKTRLNRMLD